VVLVCRGRGDDQHGRPGKRSGNRNVHHSGEVRLGDRLDDTDDFGRDAEFDCGDAGEPLDYEGCDAAIYRDRHIFRFEHAEHHQHGDVVFVEGVGGDNFGRRPGDGSGDRINDDSGDLGIGEWFDWAERYSRNAAVHCGYAGESFDHSGDESAVHRDRNIQRHVDADHYQFGDVVFIEDDGGDDLGRGTGVRRGRGFIDDTSGVRFDQREYHADGDGVDSDVDFDCGDAGESFGG
jgi:hypothetical protein